MSIGRFAPSPSGPLHAGSLVAALASHASIRARQGRFTVRIDDLDTARVVPGADTAILDCLRRFALIDDATPVVRQSERRSAYHAALHTLARADRLYRCTCSRRTLAGHAVYPGTCRAQAISPARLQDRLAATDGRDDAALRARLHGELHVSDAVQGERHRLLERDVGDVIVLRRDGVIAWPLATAVDDAAPNTEVVRGADLFDPTPAQIGLMQALQLAVPRYAHVPVLCDGAGRKLGKQTRAPALDADRALGLLQRAWAFLGQPPLEADSVQRFHAQTPLHWSIARVPAVAQRHDPRLVPS